MVKRIFGIVISVCLLALVVFTGFAIWYASSEQPEFKTDGYVLQGDGLETRQLAFAAATPYKVSSAGTVRFESISGEQVMVQRESFVHYGDGSVMALSDGILLDFNDLSDNFINNYFISAGLTIKSAGEGYTAETTAGTVTFGDHLWKLSDQKYLIQSPTLTVCYSDEDQREVEDYVQIQITEDGIAQIQTAENTWMTISEECYVETASGVRIYPMSQRIEDDNYKMSLAKLSVTANDSVVLTEDETRRQIVPELHIETIDGEDGLDGDEGQAGAEGSAGVDGSDGEDGVSGSKGQTGEKGLVGEDSEDGAAGRGGASGASGADGANGQGGLTGNPGQTGNNAVVDSSTNTALPTMTFVDWNVTATSLCGAIAIDDPNGFLQESAGDGNHAATVKIYNVETGEELLCYEMSEEYAEFLTTAEAEAGQFEGIYTSEKVYFSTKDNPLKPDTRYRISVYAYYTVNETVYSREFISRFFYTDSTGIFLSEKAVDDRSITLNVSVADAYKDNISLAEIYLLTPGQNDTFSLSSKDDYEYKIVLDYVTGKWSLYKAGTLDSNTGDSFDKSSDDFMLEGAYNPETNGYDGLPSNKKYIARVRVVSSVGMDSLTKQELAVSTLKKAPTWSDTPKATYNRVTGGFEVWRPSVTDPDGGAVNYTYTAYSADDAGDFTVEYQSRTLTPGESEPAVFFLSSGVEYRFGLTLQFDDNEKTVQYDLGMSNAIKAEGATLPSVTLSVEDQGTEYDSMSGTICINLTDERHSLKVEAGYPLELNVYSDQLYDRTISINSTDTVTDKDGVETIYTATYIPSSVSGQTNTAQVALSLFHLYKNSNYTVTLLGYLDVGDGNGPVKRAIGTVSFRTYDTVPLTAIMERSEGSGAIAMRLRLTADDASVQNATARNAYAMKQLLGGQVELQLYAGTGYGATLLATTNLNESEQLNKVFGSEGLEVTEAMFGSPTLNPSADYTLRVSRVEDGTYNMGMGYINEFATINNASAIIVAEATPPDLLMDPAKGVTAEPIYKADAAKFGATEYAAMADMPDDAIVGYTVQANYDNAQRLGLNVTYYAMEYGAFYTAVVSSNAPDPLNAESEGGVKKLMEVTLPVSSESDSVPKVAFLFGGTKSSESQGQYSGYYVYRTGEANPVSSGTSEYLNGGMDRGYRYVFAYTVEYSRTGETDSTAIYPYGHTAYNQYKEQFGVGKEYGKTLGKGNVYILNSGMCEAPRVLPQFYTYLDHVENTSVPSGGTGVPSSGTAVIHYTWTGDIDKTISTTQGIKTQICWEVPQQGSADIDSFTVGGTGTGMAGEGNASSWYSVEIPYTVDPSELTNLIRPTVQIEQYVFDYADILYALRLGTAYADEDDNIYLCRMPMDWAWGKYFENVKETAYYTFTVNEDKNYIQFDLDAEAGSEMDTLLASRAYALKVTMSAGGDEKTFYLPLENALGGGIYARLSTGLLGSDFINKTFTIKEASILYDTGDQGWSLIADKNSFVGLQHVGTVSAPSLGDYYVTEGKGNSTTSYSPKNGLIKVPTGSVLTTLRQNAFADEEKNGTAVQSIGFQNYYADSPSGGIARYLRPTHGGVDQSISPTAMTGSFLTVKGVGEYKLSAFSGSEGTITKIVPTVKFPYEIYMPATTQITLSKFSVSGAEQVTEQTVIVRMYLDAKDVGTGNLIQQKKFPLDTEGVWTPPTADQIAEGAVTGVFDGVEGLHPNRSYVLAFYMNIDGEDVLLMQADGTSDAIYTMKTSTEIDIASAMSVVQYLNQSYFDKSLQLDFMLSRSWGIKMRYDIFTSEAGADTTWGTENAAVPYLSYEDMKTSGILTEPTALNGTGNVLSINMTPSAARARLTPGRTYWLRVTALEQSSGGDVAVGSAKFGAAIPPIGNYGALVYVKNATHEKIAYEVTINDSQFSFMGKNSYLNGSGLYAVRFTYTGDDGIERRIVTEYDDQVFSSGEAKKSFELSSSTVDGSWAKANSFSLHADTEYKLHVYAVVDPDHTGVSYPTETGGTGSAWTKFFEGVSGGTGAWFTEFVNSFWQDGNYQNNADMDAVEQAFHVAEKVQKTTATGGVLLNAGKAAVGRVSDTQLRLILPESFGLVDFSGSSTGDQVYKKIAWDVDGRTLSGTAVHYNGVSLASNNDLMIQQPLAGSNVDYEYYYDIPQDIANGTYTITIQLYKDASSFEHESLSFNFYG